MNLMHRRTQLRLLTLSVAIALTILTAVRIISDALLVEVPENTNVPIISTITSTIPYIMPIAWITFLLTLFWKGRIRALWLRRGYDYDTFKVLGRMQGSDTRVKILRSLTIPKNRLQIANELGLNWRAIDAHVKILIEYNLVEEIASVGTAKLLMITERGKQALELVDKSRAD